MNAYKAPTLYGGSASFVLLHAGRHLRSRLVLVTVASSTTFGFPCTCISPIGDVLWNVIVAQSRRFGRYMESGAKGENMAIWPGAVLTDDLEFWMTRFPAPLKNIPIIHLAIPGSHDTMTYTIERHSDVGPDEPAYVRTLGRYCSFVAKPIILNWSVTQRDDIKQQLNGGVRYLDLRVATKPRTNNIYFLHGLYGAEVSKPLLDVADWLTSHANEIVILDFQHFYAFTDQDHHRLVDRIMQIFRGKLCPVSSRFNHVTLQWLALKRYQVFVIYRNVYARNYPNLWPSGLWRTVWPNTVRVDELIDFLNVELQSRSLDIAFISQCLLTPDTSYVVKHLCGTLQRDLVPRCQKAILSWINQKRPGRGGLNIVIADFVSDNNFLFSKTVIQSNTKLLHSPEVP
ncbi:PI-PLC X domain-containing protein 3 [Temnothorax nylanderi]|uniref:PI-PLC X domain-containing protein 3 n=1 Tax=Temnothorax nylanderi TaxID=102681 RepID=UPI003A8C35D6